MTTTVPPGERATVFFSEPEINGESGGAMSRPARPRNVERAAGFAQNPRCQENMLAAVSGEYATIFTQT
jgi:hypothetical protein